MSVNQSAVRSAQLAEAIVEITDYIIGTYDQHYVDQTDSSQVVDDWEEIGILKEACIANIIKYAKRFGKKNGENRSDILKLIHYAVLVLQSLDKPEQTTETKLTDEQFETAWDQWNRERFRTREYIK